MLLPFDAGNPASFESTLLSMLSEIHQIVCTDIMGDTIKSFAEVKSSTLCP